VTVLLLLLGLQVPGATSYMGCVGDDEFAQEMTKTASKDGVNVGPLLQQPSQHVCLQPQLYLKHMLLAPQNRPKPAAIGITRGSTRTLLICPPS